MSKLPNPPNGGYWYGAATSLMDGAGVAYIAGIAANDNIPKGDPARFRFSVFRIQANGLTYLPLEDEAAGLTGAGEIYTRSDGQGRYRCTSNKIAYDGPIPGFTPIKLGGGYTVAPSASVRVWMDKDGFNGKQTINLAAAGIPPCTALNIRLAVDGDVGRVLRCGPPTTDPNLQAAAMLTVTALGITARAYESGVVSVTPSRTLLVMTEGPISAGFVDVTGWWG